MTRFALAVAAAALAAGPAAAARYALVVGVNEYKSADLPPLAHAEAGARDVREALADQDYDVTLLTGGAAAPELRATRANVGAALDRLLGEFNPQTGRRTSAGQAAADDTVVVLLAGHGCRFGGDPRNYFCPADADPDPAQTATLVAVEEIQARLAQCPAAARVLLVDACRNHLRVGGGIRASALAGVGGVGVLLGCRDGAKAFEDSELGRGVFVHYVLEAVHGAKAGPGQPVRWGEVAAHVKARFVTRGADQVPDDLSGPGADAELIRQARPPRLGYPATERQAQEVQRAWARYLQRELEQDLDIEERVVLNPQSTPDKHVTMEMVLVPPGRFEMGLPAKQGAAAAAGRAVTLTRPYFIGKFEVTQKQFLRVFPDAGDAGSPFKTKFAFARGGKEEGYLKDENGEDLPTTDDLPADSVRYATAEEFCRRVTREALKTGRLAGFVCRLPTEAEWEHACRAGTTTRFHFGDVCSVRSAHCRVPGVPADILIERPLRRGVFAPNAFGLRDMHGNVQEWCRDWYGPYPREEATDPAGPNSTAFGRVLRGGYYLTSPDKCQSGWREYRNPAADPYDHIGFRVVITRDE
jgi:formylglycine-generating enzyme required for sulfatase activity